MRMTYDTMMTFAGTWIDCWNRRDINAILAHFVDEVEFVSPNASNFVERSVLRNKEELECYWRTALEHISILGFKLDHAAWDEQRRELTVVYKASLNGEHKRACEIM